MKLAKVFVLVTALVCLAVAGGAATIASLSSSLPQIFKVEDYHPLLISEVYARGGEKIGEYSRENRTLVPFEKIPKHLIMAFVAAEDDTFFEHKGVNYLAILRAFVINLTSGEKRQGASTITQQVARSFFLSSEKTYSRKLKEILLAQKLEENLSKSDILYLYLNQIYFGEGSYGVAAASDTYFRKTVDKLTLGEMAILGGLPQAPSSYSPTISPQKAKARQRYVLNRMVAIKAITPEEAKAAAEEPITVYMNKIYKQAAPHFVETLRQMLVAKLGEKAVLDEGLRIYTSIDYKAQMEATKQLQEGLRQVDKREGFRGPLKTIDTPEHQDQFLLATRKALKKTNANTHVMRADGTFEDAQEPSITVYHLKDKTGKIVSNIPDYITKNDIVEGLVTKVDDALGLTTVRFADGVGLIDINDMSWARKPDPNIRGDFAPKVTKASNVVKAGDVILVRVVGEKFTSPRLMTTVATKNKKAAARALPAGAPNFDEYAQLQLEQEPLAEASLLSIDQNTSDVMAMVGGYDFARSKYNRTIQAKRQTGSSFKTIVYAAALDRGYTPATPIQDAPIVYEGADEGQEEGKTWKPHNNEQKFEGDILFRKALIRSLNVPTIKILEDIGVSYAVDYARHLGVFSPLNNDLSLGLGSSSLTLFEMTKVFSEFGRLGRRVHPIIVHKVTDAHGKVLLENFSLDQLFDQEYAAIDKDFEQKKTYEAKPAARALTANNAVGIPTVANEHPFAAENPEQLIRPQTAYVMTTLLSGVINETGGTAGRARALGRPAAGKTGSTNGYFDGWFVGYTPQIATGVWVGFDREKSLGRGEVGALTALPIWLEYMKAAHKDLPVLDFPVPPSIVFANIDNVTGGLASAKSPQVVRQAFIEGTTPKNLTGTSHSNDEETDFLKKDLSN